MFVIKIETQRKKETTDWKMEERLPKEEKPTSPKVQQGIWADTIKNEIKPENANGFGKENNKGTY